MEIIVLLLIIGVVFLVKISNSSKQKNDTISQMEETIKRANPPKGYVYVESEGDYVKKKYCQYDEDTGEWEVI